MDQLNNITLSFWIGNAVEVKHVHFITICASYAPGRVCNFFIRTWLEYNFVECGQINPEYWWCCETIRDNQLHGNTKNGFSFVWKCYYLLIKSEYFTEIHCAFSKWKKNILNIFNIKVFFFVNGNSVSDNYSRRFAVFAQIL